MLNLTRLHLGIAHESQFQGLGIIGIGGSLTTPLPYGTIILRQGARVVHDSRRPRLIK